MNLGKKLILVLLTTVLGCGGLSSNTNDTSTETPDSTSNSFISTDDFSYSGSASDQLYSNSEYTTEQPCENCYINDFVKDFTFNKWEVYRLKKGFALSSKGIYKAHISPAPYFELLLNTTKIGCKCTNINIASVFYSKRNSFILPGKDKKSLLSCQIYTNNCRTILADLSSEILSVYVDNSYDYAYILTDNDTILKLSLDTYKIVNTKQIEGYTSILGTVDNYLLLANKPIYALPPDNLSIGLLDPTTLQIVKSIKNLGGYGLPKDYVYKNGYIYLLTSGTITGGVLVLDKDLNIYSFLNMDSVNDIDICENKLIVSGYAPQSINVINIDKPDNIYVEKSVSLLYKWSGGITEDDLEDFYCSGSYLLGITQAGIVLIDLNKLFSE